MDFFPMPYLEKQIDFHLHPEMGLLIFHHYPIILYHILEIHHEQTS